MNAHEDADDTRQITERVFRACAEAQHARTEAEQLSRLAESLGVQVLPRQTESDRELPTSALTEDVLHTLAFGLAHDLHQPLVAIDLTLGLLSYQGTDSATLEACLGSLRSAVDSLRTSIGEMLHLAQFPQRPVMRTKVDVSQYALEYLETLRASEPERPLEVDVAPGIQVTGDPDLIRLIVRNLLGNAWKYTRSVESPRLSVGETLHEGRRTVFVRDNGIGFDDSTLKGRNCVPLRAGLDAAGTEVPGFGFGMSVVKHAVQHHDGEIFCESRPGHGATFHFHLDPEEGRSRKRL